jgi:hypothetical protein
MSLDTEPIRAMLIESDAEAVELTPRDAELNEWWDSYSQLGHGAVLVRGPEGAVPPLAFFLANAPAYVAALLTEVDRLTAENEALRTDLARAIARVEALRSKHV